MNTEDRNYYNDRRVRAQNRKSLFENVNESRKIAYVDDPDEEGQLEVPIKFEVCPLCSGSGCHVNPSVDCDGLTAEDFMEDPDLAEEYMSGTYDVDCYQCHGNRVVPALDEERCSDLIKEKVNRLIKEQRTYDSERRYGA